AAALGLLAGCTSFSSSHEKRADAQLQPTVGSQARGAVTFVERPDGVQVTYNLVGLPPNSDHALQVHERGDCNAGDAVRIRMDVAEIAGNARAGA
ncbi:superoxide dismutase family protein, partial [Burkholderia cenocepacia]|nr:superoxide dismutase family protein [Burkholderia cenocepacia]